MRRTTLPLRQTVEMAVLQRATATRPARRQCLEAVTSVTLARDSVIVDITSSDVDVMSAWTDTGTSTVPQVSHHQTPFVVDLSN